MKFFFLTVRHWLFYVCFSLGDNFTIVLAIKSLDINRAEAILIRIWVSPFFLQLLQTSTYKLNPFIEFISNYLKYPQTGFVIQTHTNAYKIQA